MNGGEAAEFADGASVAAPRMALMCGIAGYSLSSRSQVDRTLAAQALLASIAERGADAVGYAHRDGTRTDAAVVKQRSSASQLLDRLAVPQEATQVLVHVRDYTKGHPSIAANNHPVRHGPVVGIHNGIITNDESLLEPHACARVEPEMTVDSEAIFAVAAHSRSDARALEALEGAMAAAWLDAREPDRLYLARSVGRPLWLGSCRDGVFFASTEHALQMVERFCGLELRREELGEGRLVALAGARTVQSDRFSPARYVESDPLPAVRAPHEREACLSRLDRCRGLARGCPRSLGAVPRLICEPTLSSRYPGQRPAGAAPRRATRRSRRLRR